LAVLSFFKYDKLAYFNALIGSTRDARCAGMKPAHSATSASATVESASTAGSAPIINEFHDDAGVEKRYTDLVKELKRVICFRGRRAAAVK
jgi:hypothetical protein